jgi:HSP20 family protein
MAKTISDKPKTAPAKKASAKKAAAKKTATKAKPKVAAKAEAPEAVTKATESEAATIFKPLIALRRQIDDLMENSFGGFSNVQFPRIEWPALSNGEGDAETAVARFDFSENDNAVTVIAEMPGMDEDDIEVSLDNGVLTIEGEKKSEREEKGENFYLSERRFGSFSRAFRLPEGISEDAITAHFKKGVLTVTMPKAPAEKKPAKPIDVKAG